MAASGCDMAFLGIKQALFEALGQIGLQSGDRGAVEATVALGQPRVVRKFTLVTRARQHKRTVHDGRGKLCRQRASDLRPRSSTTGAAVSVSQ